MAGSASRSHATDEGGSDTARRGAGRPVRAFMKPPSTVVPANATVAEAIRLLTTAHVGGAPVVVGDHVIGVVTLADLHRWTAEPDPELLDEPARTMRSLGMRLERVAIDRLLPRLAIKAGQDWPADYALTVMTRAGIQRLPVVEDDGRLIGVVAREALVAAGITPLDAGGGSRGGGFGTASSRATT
jgi:CBS domain-containing protein